MFARVVLLMLGVLYWSAAMSVSSQLQGCKTANGKIYNIGDIFTDNNCTANCECMDGGVIACKPMCQPAKAIPCANMKIRRVPINLPDAQDKSCSCPSISCEPDLCYDGKRSYKPGDGFISADCMGSCSCHSGGVVTCVSLCPPTIIRCKHNEEKVQTSRKITNTNCTCPQWQCVKEIQNAPNQVRAPTKKCISSNGKIYFVGQVFTDHGCSSKCECKDGGVVACKPLCSVMPKNKFCAKQSIVHVPVKLPDAQGRTCSCSLVMCEAFQVKEQVYSAGNDLLCFDGGRSFKLGQRFISSDCTSSCKCGPGGTVSCVSLCPPQRIKCRDDEEKIQSSRKISNSNCTCPQLECVRRKSDLLCFDGGRNFERGQRFISSDCTNSCKCGPGGTVSCVSLCPPQRIKCKDNEKTIQSSRKIPNSNCTCPQWECVKKELEFCEVFGEKHKVGERFVPKNCGGYCWCTGPLEHTCVSLCPPHGIYCNPNMRRVRTTIPAFPGSNCTCPSWKCVRASRV